MTVQGEPYHHGDLRRALLDSAGAILSETQRWDFSLREVARRAGVSHNAPYRHFADKEALLAAIGVAGFEALRSHSAAALGDASNALESLRALGVAYIEFGTENPALYRLMFGRDLARADAPADLRTAMDGARAALKAVVSAGARAGLLDIDADDEGALLAAVVAAWSLVHGFTLLSIDQALSRAAGAADPAALAQRVVDRSLRGFA